jgi:hypothetical protein
VYNHTSVLVSGIIISTCTTEVLECRVGQHLLRKVLERSNTSLRKVLAQCGSTPGQRWISSAVQNSRTWSQLLGSLEDDSCSAEDHRPLETHLVVDDVLGGAHEVASYGARPRALRQRGSRCGLGAVGRAWFERTTPACLLFFHDFIHRTDRNVS